MKGFHLAIISSLAIAGEPLLADPPSGYVVMWGVNPMSQDTNLPPLDYYSTNLVKFAGQIISNAVAITGGGSHALALLGDSTVVGWGANGSEGGAFGYPTTYPYATNAQVQLGGRALGNVAAIAAGRGFSLALIRDGTVAGWGNNQSGQTSMPAGLSNVTAIAAGAYQGLALTQEGTIASWGQGNPPPNGLSNVRAIAAGGEHGHNLALKRDGTVMDWAVRGVEYVPTVPSGLRNVVAVAAGSGHSLALKRDGTVLGWGGNWLGGATGVPTAGFPHATTGMVMIAGQILSNVVSIAAGNNYSLALKKDGTVVTWGHPLAMEITPPAGLSNVVAIAAGENFCLAITTNSQVAAAFGSLR